MKSWKKNWGGCNKSYFQIFVGGWKSNLYNKCNIKNSQRSVFYSDTALLKTLYLAIFEVSKKCILTLRNWGKIYGELQIMFEDCL